MVQMLPFIFEIIIKTVNINLNTFFTNECKFPDLKTKLIKISSLSYHYVWMSVCDVEQP